MLQFAQSLPSDQFILTPISATLRTQKIALPALFKSFAQSKWRTFAHPNSEPHDILATNDFEHIKEMQLGQDRSFYSLSRSRMGSTCASRSNAL